MLKLIKGRSLSDQASIWLAAWPQQSTRQMPTELILDGKVEKKQYQTKAPSKPRQFNYESEWTIMVGYDDKKRIEWMIIKWCWSSNGFSHLVITQMHSPILVYQQFKSWYWHPPEQFLCQLMIFQVPLKPLDNDCLPGWTQTGENGINKSVKQNTMIIIACRMRKFRNQNWRYGHRNMAANFRGLFLYFFKDPPNFQGISGTFSGVSTISGVFQGFQGFQGSLATLWYPVNYFWHEHF